MQATLHASSLRKLVFAAFLRQSRTRALRQSTGQCLHHSKKDPTMRNKIFHRSKAERAGLRQKSERNNVGCEHRLSDGLPASTTSSRTSVSIEQFGIARSHVAYVDLCARIKELSKPGAQRNSRPKAFLGRCGVLHSACILFFGEWEGMTGKRWDSREFFFGCLGSSLWAVSSSICIVSSLGRGVSPEREALLRLAHLILFSAP